MNSCQPAFVHIPKAAGSSVIHALRTYYGRDGVHVVPGPGWPTAPELGSDISTDVVLAGHILRGHATEGRPVMAFTRQPVARAHSAWRYQRRLASGALHDIAMRSSTAAEFALAAGREFDNGQVRRLVPRGFEMSRESLENATESLIAEILNGDIVVGTQENFDAGLLLMARHLDWDRPPVYWTTNVGEPAQRKSHTPIDQRSDLDHELWSAADRVARQAVTASQLNEFEKELRQFRRRVWVPMAFRSVRARAHKVLKRTAANPRI